MGRLEDGSLIKKEGMSCTHMCDQKVSVISVSRKLTLRECAHGCGLALARPPLVLGSASDEDVVQS